MGHQRERSRDHPRATLRSSERRSSHWSLATSRTQPRSGLESLHRHCRLRRGTARADPPLNTGIRPRRSGVAYRLRAIHWSTELTSGALSRSCESSRSKQHPHRACRQTSCSTARSNSPAGRLCCEEAASLRNGRQVQPRSGPRLLQPDCRCGAVHLGSRAMLRAARRSTLRWCRPMRS